MPLESVDKLYKIRSVYEFITGRWQILYNFGEHISVNEGMLKWQGRLSFKVYNKDKQIKLWH